jgi:hypothetical protein
MTGRMYFLFGSTFLIGMLSGAYLYVTAFAPDYAAGINTGEDISEEVLVIEGEMYGGCSEMDACATFRLVDGKNYDFISSGDAEIKKGKLSSSRRTSLLEILDHELLELNSQPVQNDSCDAYVDGIDYSYTVWLEGETYDLDTCSTALANNQTLQEVFLDIWYVMENPDEDGNSEPFVGNINDIFWNRFNNPEQ